MKNFAILVSIIIFLAGCTGVKTVPGLRGEGPWPLQKGNFWKYAGVFNFAPFSMGMTVTDTLHRGDLSVARMKGHPTDPLQGDDWKPLEYLVVCKDHSVWFQAEVAARTDTVLNRVRDPDDLLTGLLNAEEMILVWPLDTHLLFGPAGQLTRTDGLGSWRVRESGWFDPGTVRNTGYTQKLPRYTLRKAEGEGETLVDFVPGIGITRYRYATSGATTVLDLMLIEVGVAEASSGEELLMH